MIFNSCCKIKEKGKEKSIAFVSFNIFVRYSISTNIYSDVYKHMHICKRFMQYKKFCIAQGTFWLSVARSWWVGKPTINLNPWKWTLTVEFFHTRWFILILCFSSTLMIAFVQIIFTFPKGILSTSTVPNLPQFYCIVANYVIINANNHSFVLQYVVGNMSSLFWWKIQMHNIALTVEWFEGKRHHQKRKTLVII